MPYVNVPKDMTKVKTKVALNLTKRQLICFSLAGVVGIPCYIVTKGMIGNDAAVLTMIGLMMPFFLIAIYEHNGQPFEKVLIYFIRHHFFAPKSRYYKTENLYAIIEKIK